MRWCLFRLLPCLALALTSHLHAAEKVVFPYEATVEAKEAYVRSGPGTTKYYPTGKLKQGTKVTVQRHDPGWHMIFPPEGSFSWVPARSVERTAKDRGTIIGNDVFVFVGSFESDIREYSQRSLNERDEVQILAEKKLPPVAGNGPDELWYKIVPPRGEWRWIYGPDLSPPPRPSDKSDPADPFAVEPVARRPATPVKPTFDDTEDRLAGPGSQPATREYLDNDDALPRRPQGGESGVADRPLVRRQGKVATESPAPVTAKTKAKRSAAKADELERLDARLRSILEKAPLEWDLDDLERDYIHLRAEAEGTDLASMIDARLARFAGYRKTRAEQEEVARIAEETSRRDAELADRQRRHEFRVAAARQMLFDGAGIVQRSALDRRAGPKYALVAPSGKVTAYLVPAPGVDLEAWVGRSAGVSGARAQNPDLKADVITVRSLSPVRLAP